MNRSHHGIGWLTIPALAVALGAAPTPVDDPFGIISIGTTTSHYTGRCPAHLRFTGEVEVKVHPMVFNYQFERSDGASSQLRVVRVPANGPANYRFGDTWQLGAAGQHYNIWVKFKVASGNTHRDATTNVEVSCN